MKKATKPVSAFCDPLSELTAHQDDSQLDGNTLWLLRNGRTCCTRARFVECSCLHSMACERHGRHCFGPHDWTKFYNPEAA